MSPAEKRPVPDSATIAVALTNRGMNRAFHASTPSSSGRWVPVTSYPIAGEIPRGSSLEPARVSRCSACDR